MLTFHSVLRKPYYTYTELSKGASYQIFFHLASEFQTRRILRNYPIRNKNCLWWPCFLTDQDKMSNFNRRPSIDDSYSYSVSVHLDKRFWRRTLKYEKLTDDGCQKLTFPLARWAKNLMQEEIFLQCTKVYIWHESQSGSYFSVDLHQSRHLKSENVNIVWFILCQRFWLEH